jgi:four helix bundle protein
MEKNEVLESAVQLFKDIYTFTETWPKATTEHFSHYMDIRRAAMTLPNQITEALQDEEPVHSLTDAQATLTTLQGYLLAARDREDLDTEKFQPLLDRLDQVKAMLQDIISRP